MLAPKQRNSRTAWPNNSAPNRHAPIAPPSTDRLNSKDPTALRISCQSGKVPNNGDGKTNSTPLCLCAALKKPKNRTKRPSGLVSGGAIIAR